jgi:hypothetical protein
MFNSLEYDMLCPDYVVLRESIAEYAECISSQFPGQFTCRYRSAQAC